MTRSQTMMAAARKMLNAKNGNDEIFYTVDAVTCRLLRCGGNARPGAVRTSWYINGDPATKKDVDLFNY